MSERIVNSAWWTTIMLMIGIAAAVALFVGYRGLFELLGGRWSSGTAAIATSIAAATGAFMLCRHRNDLL